VFKGGPVDQQESMNMRKDLGQGSHPSGSASHNFISCVTGEQRRAEAPDDVLKEP
jgi:hypothetical protein